MLTLEAFNQLVSQVLDLTKKIDERLKKNFDGQRYHPNVEAEVDQMVRSMLTEGLHSRVLLEMPTYKVYMNQSGGYAVLVDQRSLLGSALNAFVRFSGTGMSKAERDELKSRCRRFPD